ncbi:hypothetical protein ACEPAF_4159 [Sanghuangporus sanghuang]
MRPARFVPAVLRRAFLFLVVFVSFATGNTEIRNFEARTSKHGLQDSNLSQVTFLRSIIRSQLHAELHKLNVTRNEQSFRVVPAPLGTSLQSVCESQSGVPGQRCPNELWLEVDLSSQEWLYYDRFTIRLSWPAFYPTDFDIQLLYPEDLMAYMYSRFGVRGRHFEENNILSENNAPDTSRTIFVRVRLVDTGVRPPFRSKPDKLPNPDRTDQSAFDTVPFNVIVEPLILGVLPATVVPTIIFSIPLLVLAWFAYPYAVRYLEDIASEAWKELYDSQARKSD